jgi:hypothetical protein
MRRTTVVAATTVSTRVCPDAGSPRLMVARMGVAVFVERGDDVDKNLRRGRCRKWVESTSSMVTKVSV